MTEAERVAIVEWRRRLERPLHSPPHVSSGQCYYLISAACFEHQAHIGCTVARMNAFSTALLSVLAEHCLHVSGWVVLPNHYHALVCLRSPLPLLKALGQLHGRTSFLWNGEEGTRGRKVWCNAVETVMKSPAHYQATLKYVHQNPVKHGYTNDWTEWPWSSAQEVIEAMGRAECERLWHLYPTEAYGAGWDDHEL